MTDLSPFKNMTVLFLTRPDFNWNNFWIKNDHPPFWYFHNDTMEHINLQPIADFSGITEEDIIIIEMPGYAFYESLSKECADRIYYD